MGMLLGRSSGGGDGLGECLLKGFRGDTVRDAAFARFLKVSQGGTAVAESGEEREVGKWVDGQGEE